MKSLRLLFPETPKSPKTSCILLASRLISRQRACKKMQRDDISRTGLQSEG